MAVVPTRMILTPAFDDTKRMTVQGSVAVNEQVLITVVGVVADGALPAGTVLRMVSQCGRIEYARFPANAGDVWGVSDADATCTLQLNTKALQGVFHQLCDDATVEAGVKLENGPTNNLYASGRTVIRNWIQNQRSPVAGSSQLQAQLDVLTGRIENHQHDATAEGESSFPHNNLLARDVAGCHPALEAVATGARSAANTAQSAADAAASNASTALDVAQQAANVTDMIQDAGAFTLVATNATLASTKTLLNQIAAWLNERRAV